MYWWNWTTDPAFGGLDNECMDPKGKYAELVLIDYYGGKPYKMNPSNAAPQCLCTL